MNEAFQLAENNSSSTHTELNQCVLMMFSYRRFNQKNEIVASLFFLDRKKI